MALTTYERQKRWREKNRALYNRRRRDKRKERVKEDVAEDQPISKMDELRQLVKMVNTEPVAPVAKPLIYRNDYGQVINETQWNALQKRKQEAKDGGYEIDDFSQ